MASLWAYVETGVGYVVDNPFLCPKELRCLYRLPVILAMYQSTLAKQANWPNTERQRHTWRLWCRSRCLPPDETLLLTTGTQSLTKGTSTLVTKDICPHPGTRCNCKILGYMERKITCCKSNILSALLRSAWTKPSYGLNCTILKCTYSTTDVLEHKINLSLYYKWWLRNHWDGRDRHLSWLIYEAATNLDQNNRYHD
jgi:hypothetical protein